MSSEYEPLFSLFRGDEDSADLEAVQQRFARAARPFLHSPWPWVAWAAVLPAAALATPAALGRWGPSGVLALWSCAILAAGAVELTMIRRGGRRRGTTALAGWVLHAQGNLSLVALALSLFFLWVDLLSALPGLWLLLLGHSFYILGGLAFRPMRLYGLLYQAGAVAALWPGSRPLVAFAVVTAVANLWMAWAVGRERDGTT